MRIRLLGLLGLLGLLVFCGGTPTDGVEAAADTTTTTVQDTTTTTVQDTTTTTVQDTTTTTVQDTTATTTMTESEHSTCEKGDTSDECMAQRQAYCEENPDADECADYDAGNMSGSSNQSGGNMSGSSNQSGGNMSGSGGMSGSDDPPSLMNLLILNWGPYDSSTAVSGDFEFSTSNSYIYFDEFGRVHSAGTPNAYDNPAFEYKVPLDTKVYIPADGIVDFIQWQPSSGYKQDDWELTIKPRDGSDWRLVIDHIVSISCERSAGVICDNPITVNGVQLTSGMEVKAGDLLGYVGNFEDGDGNAIGRTEITVGKYVAGSGSSGGNKNFNNYCPMNYLHESVKSTLEASVTQLMASYESWKGDAAFYDEADMIAPGCWYSEILEDGNTGKTVPTK